MLTKTYEECDTLFYQGMNSSQTQALKYVGDQKIRATTGELMWCVGKNTLLPLKVIYRLHIGQEIADVNLKSLSTLYSALNPVNLLGSAVTWTSNYLNGFQFSPATNPTTETVRYHSPVLSNISIGQITDIESHRNKYQSWQQRTDKTEGLILYGVSRGTAATFRSFAKEKYPEVTMVILEGAIDSIENVLFKRSVNKLRYDALAKVAYNGINSNLSFFTQYKSNGISPLSCVAEYPEHIPTVFITSKLDGEVPSENTERIANALADKGKNDVYLLKLNNSSHPNYMFDDQKDRDCYETFIHALYKKYNLKHDPDLALRGEPLIQENTLFEVGQNDFQFKI